MSSKRNNRIAEYVLFAMFGALMYVSKLVMQMLPNIHLIGTFIVAFTVVYRVKALAPVYVFVFLCGLFDGFGIWWIPYLYIWTVLWGAVMLLPRSLFEGKKAYIFCPLVSGLFGLAFGTLYAPAQALLAGFGFSQTLAWIAAGLPFDAIHAAGNFACGFLAPPLIKLLGRLKAHV